MGCDPFKGGQTTLSQRLSKTIRKHRRLHHNSQQSPNYSYEVAAKITVDSGVTTWGTRLRVSAVGRLRTTAPAERLSWALNPYWSIFTHKHSTMATVRMTLFVVCVLVHTCADTLMWAGVGCQMSSSISPLFFFLCTCVMCMRKYVCGGAHMCEGAHGCLCMCLWRREVDVVSSSITICLVYQSSIS